MQRSQKLRIIQTPSKEPRVIVPFRKKQPLMDNLHFSYCKTITNSYLEHTPHGTIKHTITQSTNFVQ